MIVLRITVLKLVTKVLSSYFYNKKIERNFKIAGIRERERERERERRYKLYKTKRNKIQPSPPYHTLLPLIINKK
jgi:hypothetical protein